MSVLGSLAKSIARLFGLGEAAEYLGLTLRAGRPSEAAFPKDLVPMAGRMISRGLANQMIIQANRDWVWPYWAERQYDPHGSSFIPRMSWIQFNLTHRNWTAVGPVESEREAVVDPRGLLVPWHEGFGVDLWLEVDGRTIFPSRAEKVEQFNREDLPIVVTQLELDKVTLKWEAVGLTARGKGLGKGIDGVVLRAWVHNAGAERRSVRLYFCIRPANPEGLFPIKSISFDHTLSAFMVDGKLGLVLAEPPSLVACGEYDGGDLALRLSKINIASRADCRVGLAHAIARYDFDLKPDRKVTAAAFAPLEPRRRSKSAIRALGRARPESMAEAAAQQWRAAASQGLTVELPDAALQSGFTAAKAQLLLADDGDHICPGPVTYHHYWFRDSAYMVTALDRMGLTERASRKLVNYPKRQRRDGFFISQDGEWDSAGQAIWTLVEHARLTGDVQGLAPVYQSIVRGADWIVRKRKTTMKQADQGKPHFGLLPPGFSAEHLGPNDYFYWDDFWGLAGLRDAAWAAEQLGNLQDRSKFQSEYESFLHDIQKSLEHVEARLGAKAMPASPYRRIDSGAIGSIVALYPLKLLAPDDPWISGTLDGLHEKTFFEDGFFQDMIHSGVNAYLSMHIAQCHLARREAEQAWRIIRYIVDLATPTFTWPEAVHPITKGGCMGDGHHFWATADWLLLVRNLLLCEQDGGLSITPIPPKEWAAPGARVSASGAPTHFGKVTFVIEAREREVALSLDCRWRKKPAHIEWTLPFHVTSARIDGVEQRVDSNVIKLGPNVRQVAAMRG